MQIGALECGGLTPLSFFGPRRPRPYDWPTSRDHIKKAVSSHRTPKISLLGRLVLQYLWPRQRNLFLQSRKSVDERADRLWQMIGIDLDAQHAGMIGHGREGHRLHV